jgi:hypothetical protein
LIGANEVYTVESSKLDENMEYAQALLFNSEEW